MTQGPHAMKDAMPSPAHEQSSSTSSSSLSSFASSSAHPAIRRYGMQEPEAVAKVNTMHSEAWIESFWEAMSHISGEIQHAATIPTANLKSTFSGSLSKSSSSVKKSPKQRSVEFAEYVQMWTVPNCEDLTERDKKRLWHPQPPSFKPKKSKKNKKTIPFHLLRCQSGKRARKNTLRRQVERRHDQTESRSDDDNESDWDDRTRLIDENAHNSCDMDDDDDDDDDGDDDRDDVEDADIEDYAVQAVLEEQRAQQQEGYIDEHVISKIYQRCCAYSSLAAQKRGTVLELEVQHYHQDTSKRRKRRLRWRFPKRSG